MTTNVYMALTEEFNEGQLRAIVTSGQAVVLHRLAIMSKDGDWILREEEDTLSHIRSVLKRHNARYRFGAPLDIRWMKGGWSSHFEYLHGKLRMRTDFFTRPPRISMDNLRRIWQEQEGRTVPVTGLADLAEIKKTNRLKDYAVIAELARIMENPREQLLYSRSARDIIALGERCPELLKELSQQRDVLKSVSLGRDKLEEAIDRETRQLMRKNEIRLECYLRAAVHWRAKWPDVSSRIKDMPLDEAHACVVEEAESVLPFEVEGVEQ